MESSSISIFHELMANRVREILLVSSPYDAFIMEEDISLASRLASEYQGLNLSSPPRIKRVTSARAALHLLEQKKYDLVITMLMVGEVDGWDLGRQVKKIYSDLPVVLLAHNLKGVYPLSAGVREGIDNIFVWSIDPDLLLAIVKNVEDCRNATHDTTIANVPILLLIDDSPLYRSNFLPLLYREVVRQTQAVLDDSLNAEHRLLKMRARPKILVAEDYEEALDIYQQYHAFVIGIISDVSFPRYNKMDNRAGFELLSMIRADVPDLPLLMLSSNPENRQQAEDIPAVFLDKKSSILAEQIHRFFLKHLGFGDFVFRLPDGREVARAVNFTDLERKLALVSAESLMYHAGLNHFSTWILARSEVDLAARLRKVKAADFPDSDAVRQYLIGQIHNLRRIRQQGMVVRFDPDEFDAGIMDFVKIGSGSLGGKARGLAFMRNYLFRAGEFVQEEIKIRFPRTLVISSAGFTAFVEENSLHYLNRVDGDEVIARSFLTGRMPDWLKRDLAIFLNQVKTPLSVRSSSLLEDAQFRPYAGLYKTWMIPNNHPDFKIRLSRLIQAVKLVYASTWFTSPRAFSRRGRQSGDDSMAVLIQQLVGSQYGDYFYPAVSGVAQSYNFYPVGPMQPEEGIVHIALGFGKTVVEGENSLRFSPRYPKVLPQFSTVADILKNSQRYFYALKMADTGHFTFQSRNLEKRELSTAENETLVQMLTSAYIPAEQRIRDGSFPGPRVLTFAPILKYHHALPDLLARLLALGHKGMGTAVELEFAVNMGNDPADFEFYFLQIRPMVVGAERFEVKITKEEEKQAFCISRQALGHGMLEMGDLLYVRPENFNPRDTTRIAAEIGSFNGRLGSERPYLLIGPGRWGSADPWLGIPVQWQDIGNVGAIVELRNDQLRVDPSQGTHFFHNITSLAIPYFTVDEDNDHFDWGWLEKQPTYEETEFLRHIRLDKPMLIKVDGRSSLGVINA